MTRQKLNAIIRQTGYSILRIDEITYINNKISFNYEGFQVVRRCEYYHIFWDSMRYYIEIDYERMEMSQLANLLDKNSIYYSYHKNGIWIKQND